MATKKKEVEIIESTDSVDLEIIVDPVEQVDKAEQSVVPQPGVDGKVHTIIANDGDSYASLAVQYANGRKAHALAKEFYALNRGAIVRPGSRILVK